MGEHDTTNVIEIATSFSKKISLANYGGRQYESEDIFVSLKNEVILKPDGTEAKQVEQHTASMNRLAQDIGEKLINERIAKIKR